MLRKPRQPIEKTGWKEIGWFVGLWVAGVVAVLGVAFLVRLTLGL